MASFQTDSLRPAALPSANLGSRNPSHAIGSSRTVDFSAAASTGGGASGSGSGTGTGGGASGGATTQSLRHKFHDDWNIRIDQQVKAVSNGLKELVELADIGTDINTQAQQPLPALHLKLRTSQLIRATQSLRDTAHELKLLLLLSDEMDIARKRDEEVRAVKRDVRKGREDVARAFVSFVSGRTDQATSSHHDNGPSENDQSGESNGGDGGAAEPIDVDDEDERARSVADARSPSLPQPSEAPLPPSSSSPHRPQAADTGSRDDAVSPPNQVQGAGSPSNPAVQAEAEDGGDDEDDDMEEV